MAALPANAVNRGRLKGVKGGNRMGVFIPALNYPIDLGQDNGIGRDRKFDQSVFGSDSDFRYYRL